jgi:glycerol-3-phosphate dehydrogenase
MSFASRGATFRRLAAAPVDVLIIGGGIVGAGIARDAAMRGLRVALLEQGDFAGGTSSKTSKLIHGGLRYLEHGRLRLVRESLRERRVLRTIAPALVRPLPLLLPVYEGDARPAWQVNVGLWLYDLLAGDAALRRHRVVSSRRALALEPGLRMEGLRAAGLYADCQMDDARLCLANVLQAASFGALCLNYVRVRALLKSAAGKVCGAAAEDVLTGRTLEVAARAVINAAGPWGDDVRRLSDPSAPGRLAPTKGIHLLLPRLAEQGLFAQARADGRMLFLLPWGEHTLVGTTEGPVDGPLEALTATADEVGYLLGEVNRVLPGSHVGEEDVIATFAGARPLLAFSGPATRASREHRIEVDDAELISAMGGKYTTYRVQARQVVDFVVSQRRWRADRCLTDQVTLMEAPHPVAFAHWQEAVAAMDPDLVVRLLARYGAGAFHILRDIAQARERAQPVCPHHDYVEAELVHAVLHERACTLTDVLARRTRIAWSSCQGLDLLSTLVDVFRRCVGASAAEMDRQVDQYQQFLSRSLAFRPVLAAGRHWAGDQERA